MIDTKKLLELHTLANVEKDLWSRRTGDYDNIVIDRIGAEIAVCNNKRIAKFIVEMNNELNRYPRWMLADELHRIELIRSELFEKINKAVGFDVDDLMEDGGVAKFHIRYFTTDWYDNSIEIFKSDPERMLKKNEVDKILDEGFDNLYENNTGGKGLAIHWTKEGYKTSQHACIDAIDLNAEIEMLKFKIRKMADTIKELEKSE